MSGYMFYDRDFLRLLEIAPFERRRGGWRFGTRRISTRIVERLIASGRAVMQGDRIFSAATDGTARAEGT